MGKCILAGHPPVGGQIGYGTYAGNGEASRFISLGVTPKWVLVFAGGYLTFNSSVYGGLAISGSPVKSGTNAITIVGGGFQVFYDTNNGIHTNNPGYPSYNYIYGT